jgi:hypothetical protein
MHLEGRQSAACMTTEEAHIAFERGLGAELLFCQARLLETAD